MTTVKAREIAVPEQHNENETHLFDAFEVAIEVVAAEGMYFTEESDGTGGIVITMPERAPADFPDERTVADLARKHREFLASLPNDLVDPDLP